MVAETPVRLRRIFRAALLALPLALAGCVAPPPSANQSNSIPTKVLVPPTTSAPSQSPRARLLTEARTFVYRVRSVACLVTGSSFASGQGIVTNRHVAGGSTSLELSTWNGTDFNATVEAISGGPDLALLARKPPKGVPPVNDAALSAGTKVWAAGYPLGDQLTITPGRLVEYIDGGLFGEPGQVMEITNAIRHGNSGGPLLDNDGRVVGVVFAIDTLNNYGLAIPASSLSQFVDSPGTSTLGQCVNESGSGNSGAGNSGSGAVDISPIAANPLAGVVQETLETYFEGIDSQNFSAAYSAYSPSFQATISESAFASGDATSTISAVVVDSLNTSSGNDVIADVSFTSAQAPQDGPVAGQTCTNWSLAYTLVPASSGNTLSYLIDSVAPIGPGSGYVSC